MSFTGPGRQRSITVIPQTPRGLLDAFRFDAILTASESHPGQAFKHPVQLGVEGLTDAVYLDSPTLSATGVVGDNPVELLAGLLGPVTFGTTDRAISLYDQLISLRAQRVPLTILSSWRPPLANRWIESIDATRGAQSGNTIELSVSFVKMRFAVTQVVPSQIDSDVLLLAQQTIDISAVPTQV